MGVVFQKSALPTILHFARVTVAPLPHVNYLPNLSNFALIKPLAVHFQKLFYSRVEFNSRWGSIISIFVFGWGFIHVFIGWGCNQEWGFNGADTVYAITSV